MDSLHWRLKAKTTTIFKNYLCRYLDLLFFNPRIKHCFQSQLHCRNVSSTVNFGSVLYSDFRLTRQPFFIPIRNKNKNSLKYGHLCLMVPSRINVDKMKINIQQSYCSWSLQTWFGRRKNLFRYQRCIRPIAVHRQHSDTMSNLDWHHENNLGYCELYSSI